MRLSTYALLIVSPFNLVTNIILVHYTPLGLLGSPFALSLTYWLAFIVLVILTIFSPQHKVNATWGGWHLKEALRPGSVWMFLSLALPGILMVGTEW